VLVRDKSAFRRARDWAGENIARSERQSGARPALKGVAEEQRGGNI
jgi:hypothetical protein